MILHVLKHDVVKKLKCASGTNPCPISIFINQRGRVKDILISLEKAIIFFILGKNYFHLFFKSLQHIPHLMRDKRIPDHEQRELKAFLCLKIVLSKKLFLFNTFWMKSLNETNEPHEKSQLFFLLYCVKAHIWGWEDPVCRQLMAPLDIRMPHFRKVYGDSIRVSIYNVKTFFNKASH